MKYLQKLTLLFCLLLPTILLANNREGIESAYRLELSANSTIKNPTYFACIVRPSKQHPALSKWTPKLMFTNVHLTNYAQNTLGFAGNGALQTTAGYLNSHYFKTYHDDDFPKSTPGFVDAFALWAGYQIECRDITDKVKLADGESHKNFHKKIKLKLRGKKYKLKLAGSDYT